MESKKGFGGFFWIFIYGGYLYKLPESINLCSAVFRNAGTRIREAGQVQNLALNEVGLGQLRKSLCLYQRWTLQSIPFLKLL